MKVNFKEIKFKNILSYGNKETTFTFKEGLSSITGRNGHGKSTIIDILSYNLFGQPYRKIKINELLNRTNKKNLLTDQTLEINGVEYRIVRGLKKNIFKIYKNGEEIELLSSKRLIQDELNDILGINHNLFKQIIALALNANKPFLTLSAGDKRSIIETIFNIDVFGTMTKEVKKDLTDLKVDLSIKKSELRGVEGAFEALTYQKESIVTAHDNFETDKEKDLTAIDKIIADFKSRIKKTASNIAVGNKSLEKLTIIECEGCEEELSTLKQETSVLQYKIKSVEEHNEVLKEDYCTKCGHDIDEAHKNKHLKENKAKLKEYNSTVKANQTRITEITKILKENQATSKKISEISNAINKAEEKLEWNTDELEKAKKNKKVIQDRTLDIDVLQYNEQIEAKEVDVKTLTSTVDDISDKIETNTILIDILSENGVKSHFIKKLLPILNKKINTYFEHFEMPFIFKFDDMLEESIIAVDGTEASYFACSEGEKKRIDISILLSFIDTIKEISNFDCNLLFFDELLDSAVDSTNLNLIITAIKEMTIHDPNLAIYVISHRSYSGIWDNIVEINKKGGFSEIKIVE
jgi:DNA repair exonuclease SbcCD ATPase subunit